MQPQRHRLIRVYPAAWDALLQSRADLLGEPLLKTWALNGWPLIVRRPLSHEHDGLPVGLPLPPAAGKRRIALLVQPDDIVSVALLPALSDVIDTAPSAWQGCLRKLVNLAHAYDVEVRAFGSIAWQHMTGLLYLNPDSDLDLIGSLPRHDRIWSFLDELHEIAVHAPMRLDGELVREDGAGVNWRDLHSRPAEVAIKTVTDVCLSRPETFIGS